MNSKIDKKSLFKAVLVLTVLISVVYWRGPLLDIFSLMGNRDAIVEFLRQYGVFGQVFLFFILALQVFLAVIPGHAFMVAGGYIYGFMVGTLITLTSTVISSQIAFLLTRRYGRPMVDRISPPNVIDHWNKIAEKQGGLFFFFSFILPIFPSDLMCFIAGLCPISPRKFFLANFFGRLPCAIFVTLIGSHGFELPLYFWVLLIIGIIFLCVFWRKFSHTVEQHFCNTNLLSRCICGS